MFVFYAQDSRQPFTKKLHPIKIEIDIRSTGLLKQGRGVVINAIFVHV